MNKKNNNFPPHIAKLLEKKGYFELTTDEKVSAHKDTLSQLKKVPHFDYNAGREALRELRGKEEIVVTDYK